MTELPGSQARGRAPWLNVDLGELPGEPEALYACTHVANVACGGHAGDRASMRGAAELCLASGAILGAHPSYPDREGFGRRRIAIAPDALRATVRQQCAELRAIGAAVGLRVDHVKPHGALYHAAGADPETAESLLRGTIDALGPDLVVIGPPRGALLDVATGLGLRYAREGFADRATLPDGSLVPRGTPGAVLSDPAAAARRTRELAAQRGFDTICVHGDTPGAVSIARAVRAVLDELGGA